MKNQTFSRWMNTLNPMLILGFHISVFIFLALRYYTDEIINGGNIWSTADWFVSWHEGFVRRGAAGSVFELFTGSLHGQKLLIAMFLYQQIFLAIYFICVTRILIFAKLSMSANIVLICSPLYLTFWIVNPMAYLRKEVIGLSAAAYFAYLYQRRLSGLSYFLPGVILWTLACLSHESCLLVLPFLASLVIRMYRSGGITRKEFILRIGLLTTVALISALFSLLFKWLRPSFCEYIIQRGLNKEFCDEGGVAWAMNPGWWNDLWSGVNSTFHFYFPTLFIIFAIFILPLLQISQDRGPSIILLTVTFLCAIPVFATSYDWGRWLFIIGNTIILNNLTTSRFVSQGNSNKGTLLTLILYFFTQLPFCCSSNPIGGVAKYFSDLLNQ